MRIEAGSHPAALYITAIYIDGVPVEGPCRWADVEAGEVGRYIDNYEVEVLRGAVTFDIADEHRHWLAWEPAGDWQAGEHPQ